MRTAIIIIRRDEDEVSSSGSHDEHKKWTEDDVIVGHYTQRLDEFNQPAQICFETSPTSQVVLILLKYSYQQ